MKFSVIIPVYNVEKYLEACINSAINQDYDDYEIILVDDGSIDESGNICDEFSDRFNYIKVIHKKNGGLSDARNEGIKKAKGDYLVFIDSDDYLCKNDALSNIAKIIDSSKCDLVIYGVNKFFEDSNKLIEKNNFLPDNNKQIIESLIKQNYFKASACDKVIRKNIITKNQLFFEKGRLSEDIEWCAKILKSIDLDKISVLNENIYVYRQRKNSISKSIDLKIISDIIQMITNEYMAHADKGCYIINSYLAYEYSVLLGLMSTRNIRKKIPKELKEEILSKKELLNYDLSDKVKKVNKLVKLLGIRCASRLLGTFIDMKQRKGF